MTLPEPISHIFSYVSEKVSSLRDISSRFLFSNARFFITPQWYLTENWLNSLYTYNNKASSTAKKIFEIAKSSLLSVISLPTAISGLLFSQIAHLTGYIIATTPYIHLQGNIKAKSLKEKQLTILQDNCCLTAGGFAKMFGGTNIPDSQRVEQFAEIIKKNDPDIICMQEVSDIKSAYKLYDLLKNDYAEFIFNTNPHKLTVGNNSGLFVASKVKISKPEFHSFSSIPNTEKMANKGFFTFSTKMGTIINTHLSPSKDDANPSANEIYTRMQEEDEIHKVVLKRNLGNNLPVYVMGDLNVNWNSLEYQISPFFKKSYDQYNDGRKNITDIDATNETGFLIGRNWHQNEAIQPDRRILDYFRVFFKGSKRIKTTKLSTFDVNAVSLALTDHAALLTEISG